MSKTARSQEEDDYEEVDQHPAAGILKCPSAPNIHQHKLYPPPRSTVPSMLVTPASNDYEYAQNLKHINGPKSSKVKMSLSPLMPKQEIGEPG